MVDTLCAVFNSDTDEQKFNEMWNAVVEEYTKLSIDEPVLYHVNVGRPVG